MRFWHLSHCQATKAPVDSTAPLLLTNTFSKDVNEDSHQNLDC